MNKFRSNKYVLFIVIAAVMLLGTVQLIRSYALVAGPLGQTGNWVMKFDDEFDGTALDTTKWGVNEPWNGPPGYTEGPQAYCPLPLDVNNNKLLNVSNGTLKMNAINEPAGGLPQQSCPITSRNKFDQIKIGYTEARVKMPGGADLWPAFWLLGNGTGTSGWPGTGEVDIFEFVNNGGSNGVPYFTVHYAGPCDQWNHCQKSQSNPYPAAITDYNSRFVTFGLNRTATALEVYIDGKFAYKFTNDMKNDNGVTLPAVLFNDPMHIRFDLSSGGWADNTAKAPEPGTFEIDYVRYWEAGAADTTIPTTSITAPAANATFANVVGLNADAADNVGVSRVEFLIDGAKVGESATVPYAYNWDSKLLPNGTHTVSSQAFDAAGNATKSAGVAINTLNATSVIVPKIPTASLPDMVVTNTSTSPGNPLTGQPTVFTSVIKNQGTV